MMAKIRLVRIDSRLGHGKTIRDILNKYDLNRLIFANDKICEDKIRREVLGLTVPEEIEVNFLKISEVKEFLSQNQSEYFLIVENTSDLEKIIDDGNKIEEVNIGIIHMAMGKKILTDMVTVDSEDFRIFRKLSHMGIETYIRKEIADPRVPIEKFYKIK